VGDRDGGDSPPPPLPLPHMPDFGQLWVALMAAILKHAEHAEVVGCPSTTFLRHSSPMFDGNEGPIAADDWITSFEDLADALSCTDGQKVDYAGLKLKGETRH
jgi:hypothetical protein